MNTDKITARLLAEILRVQGVETVVFSPGSRSAPLVIAFTALPAFKCHVIPDERSAAYFALGMAQQSGKAVAIICTSGTAVLNFAPALCEAFYQQIPLIAITADRPLDMQNKGENQTINQVEIYKNYTKDFLQLPLEIATQKSFLQTIENISNIVKLATVLPQGPVHINVPFAEPLYEFTTKQLPPFTIHQTKNEVKNLSEAEKIILHTAEKMDKIMLVAGIQKPSIALQHLLQKINQNSNIVFAPEVTANFKTDAVLLRMDASIANVKATEFAAFSPDLIITFGKQIVSKRLRTFISKNKNCIHWHVSESGNEWTIFDRETTIFKVSEEVFFAAFATLNFQRTTYEKDWLEKQKAVEELTAEIVDFAPHSDLKVYDFLWKNIPAKAMLQWGNSSAIRYANLLHTKNENIHFSNRGTSGIDGSLSTAIGAAQLVGELTFCVLGDISFLYDSNALWNEYIHGNIRIIIVNNSGGNIFRWIPGPKKVNNFEKYFETKHSHNAEILAEMYGLDYFYCQKFDELAAVWPHFISNKNKKAKIMEVQTDGELSETVLKKYFTALEKI